MRKYAVLLVGLLLSILGAAPSWAQDDERIDTLGRAVVPVEAGVDAQYFFDDAAPFGFLPHECELVDDDEAPCNQGMGAQSFKQFIARYNQYDDYRQIYLFSNYSSAEDEAAMARRFGMTMPHFKENHILPIVPKPETMVHGVKNYGTFFGVTKNHVGYRTVVSFKDRYMIATLGFVRYQGAWYLTESLVGFLNYRN